MGLKSASNGLSRLLGLPLSAEAFVQNILLLGFFVLLLLVAGIGYWSRESSIQVDEEITSLTQSEIRHLGIVLRISETAGVMWNEARTVLGYDESDLLSRAARNKLSDLRREMDGLIRQARMTRLAGSDEMLEFEAAYSGYWDAIQQPASPDWAEKRDRMEKAIAALEDWTERERQQNEALARSLNLEERQKVVVTTIAAIVVGLLVAGLTFYEIRRILGHLSRAYRQSAESRDYLQSLFDGLVSGVIVINRDGTVRTISDSFTKLTGFRREAVLDRTFSEVFEAHDYIIDQISKLLASDLSESRYLGRVELGRDRLFDLFASPLMISGDHRGLILVLMDITETERAQSELRRNRALAAVGQMTAQIAHEIKNPLGSIRFAAEIMKRNPATDPQSRETVEVIDRSVDHLAAIIAELSEFARPKELNLMKTDLNELLDGLSPMLADRLTGKNLEIRRSYSHDLPAGLYDQTELRKLFLNLIINAIDASEPGDVIELQTKLDGENSVLVEVIDRGCGMDMETLRRLFEPFYTTKKAGTGLGMAISKKIAELHRGDLEVESRQGAGTRVTVRLPLN